MQSPTGMSDGLPCALCPEQRLNQYLESPGGRLISAVLDLDFALQMRIPVTLAEITYPEFLVLRQLAEERAKWEKEEIDRKSHSRGH